MKMNENDLGKVAGGTAVETKEGKWILTPPDAPTFDTKEAAEEAEKNFMKDRPQHGGHGHGKHPGKPGGFMPPMRRMGPPQMDDENEAPGFGPEGSEQK